MKKNVLVFPCGSEIGLEVYRSLIHSTHFNLIGASSVDDHGRFVFNNYIDNIPFVTNDSFLPALKNVIKEYKIDIIYPAMDKVVAVLKRAESELGCVVVGSSFQTTEVCLSKRLTYELLKDIIRVPRTYESILEVQYPVFVKPNVGYGARGAMRVDNEVVLKQQLSECTDIVISELLTGEEYTIDCFTDRHGKLIFWAPRCRNRISNGISVSTFPVERTGEFREFVDKINGSLSFRGAWFVQVKRNSNGELVLLEIASRLGGSSALYRAKGVNFAQLSLFDALGRDVDICENDYNIVMDRALDNRFKIDISYNEVFIDFDDCLFLDKKYFNLDVIKFIYQCKNKGVRVTLLSRHDGDLLLKVSQLCIESLFDNIIHITDDSQKSKYINNLNSIFIDDSFAERRNVAEVCHIPVFSVDMIPILIN